MQNRKNQPNKQNKSSGAIPKRKTTTNPPPNPPPPPPNDSIQVSRNVTLFMNFNKEKRSNNTDEEYEQYLVDNPNATRYPDNWINTFKIYASIDGTQSTYYRAEDRPITERVVEPVVDFWIRLDRVMCFPGQSQSAAIDGQLRALNEMGCHLLVTHFNNPLCSYTVTDVGAHKRPYFPAPLNVVFPRFLHKETFFSVALIVTDKKVENRGDSRFGRYGYINDTGVYHVIYNKFRNFALLDQLLDNLSDKNSECTGFYVSRGARLVFGDECADNTKFSFGPNDYQTKEENGRTVRKHNRSLFLGGTYLQVEGVVVYAFATNLNKVYTKEELENEERELFRYLAEHRKIIFLYALDSKNESLCYLVMQLSDVSNFPIKSSRKNMNGDDVFAKWLMILPDRAKIINKPEILSYADGSKKIVRELDAKNSPYFDYMTPPDRYEIYKIGVPKCFNANRDLCANRRKAFRAMARTVWNAAPSIDSTGQTSSAQTEPQKRGRSVHRRADTGRDQNVDEGVDPFPKSPKREPSRESKERAIASTAKSVTDAMKSMTMDEDVDWDLLDGTKKKVEVKVKDNWDDEEDKPEEENQTTVTQPTAVETVQTGQQTSDGQGGAQQSGGQQQGGAHENQGEQQPNQGLGGASDASQSANKSSVVTEVISGRGGGSGRDRGRGRGGGGGGGGGRGRGSGKYSTGTSHSSKKSSHEKKKDGDSGES